MAPRLWLAGIALLIQACGSGGTGDNEPELPRFFRLEANATTQEGDLAVDCTLDFIVEVSGEVSRTDSVVEYVATMGGTVRRSLLRQDGSGVEFSADAYYPHLQVLHLLPNRVQLVSLDFPPDSPPSGSRFWDELRFFDGLLRTDGRIDGDWLCAPLDTTQGGITDDTIFASGAWDTTTLTQ